MIPLKSLYAWCKVPMEELLQHPQRRVPLRLVRDSEELGRVMAREIVDVVAANNARGSPTRVIVPCGPMCWYKPFTEMVNSERVSLRNVTVFHMDECLDWQGRPLPTEHPYNFRTFMERDFYGGIRSELAVPEEQRYWLLPSTIGRVAEAIAEAPLDVTIGGWGQDGHVAYNQARRHPYSQVTVEDVASSTIRVQENNLDTIIALAHRTFGGAYQFVPPMSVTLGMRECLSARRVRVYSDTGAWKQTAFRIALFAEPTPEYPITLLQRHSDAIVTATKETARHPLEDHPEWQLLAEEP